jgi:hypothetical protein
MIGAVERPDVDDRMETAAQLLHERRHRMGSGQECDQCREDVRVVAEVLLGDHR